MSGRSEPRPWSPVTFAISAMTRSMPGMAARTGGKLVSAGVVVAGGVVEEIAFCRISGSFCVSVEPTTALVPKPLVSTVGERAMISDGSVAVANP